METFHDRMKILIEMFGKGRKHTFGKKVLIPKATMQRYVDERIPSAEHLIAIHETFGVNLNWLFTGKGKMLVTEEIPQQKEVEVDYTKYFDQLLEAQKEIAELRLKLQRYEDHPMQTRTQKGSRLVG